MFDVRWGLKKWQQRWVLVLFLGFGVGIVGLSLWRQSVKQVDQEIGSTKQQNIPQSLLLIPSVPGYTFPDHGVLPDNPLYLLQMIRDRLETWTVKGAHDTVSLNLGHADIRLMVALALLQKGEMEQGAESSVKAERYIQGAVDGLQEYGTNEANQSEWQRIYRTAQVHALVLERFTDVAPEAVKQTISLAVDENKRIQEDVKARLL